MAFEMFDDEELARIEALAPKGGTQMKESTKELLEAFDALEVGKAFRVPVPEGTPPENYRTNINNLLVSHERRDREVRINPEKPAELKVKKIAKK